MKEIKIFMAYAPEDEEYKDQLSKHLSALKEEGYISEWSAGEVLPGADILNDLRKRMSQCDIIALLLSADFVGSDHGVELEEMAFALKAKKGTVLVPIKIRACLLSDAYAQFSMLPDQSKPVDDPAWGSRDQAYMNIAEGIKKLALSMEKAESPEPNRPTVVAADPPAVASVTPGSGTPKKSMAIKVIAGVIGVVILALAAWFLIPKPDKDAEAYAIAKQSDTIEAYENYLKEYPEGDFVSEANHKIETIKTANYKAAAAAEWKKATDVNNLTAYRYYVDNYPDGDSVEAGNARILQLSSTAEDDKAYMKATEDGEVEDYFDYMEDYGSTGRHYDEAVTGIKKLLTSGGWAYYGESNTDNRMKDDRYFNQIEGEKEAQPKAGDLVEVKKAINIRTGPKNTFASKGSLSAGKPVEIVEVRPDGPTAFWVKIEY